MACDLCGADCHGKYCLSCTRVRERDFQASDAQPSDDEKRRWECASCGHEFVSTEWEACPECQSRRRRAAESEVSA